MIVSGEVIPHGDPRVGARKQLWDGTRYLEHPRLKSGHKLPLGRAGTGLTAPPVLLKGGHPKWDLVKPQNAF